MPFLGDDGFLRVGGRLSYSALTESAKHPMIFPKNHPFVRLLIRDAHERNQHAGLDWVHAHLRQKYWILSGRQVAKTVIKRCVTCNKLQGPRGNQQISQLPPVRVRVQEPFSHVGTDYTGAIKIRQCNETRWAYIVLFTCLTTRAVHLELVGSKTAKEFIMALKRMIASKGTPTDLYSDNAKNFMGSKALIENMGNVHDGTNLPTQIKWHFSTKVSPHTGGVWERMIQSVKRPLKKMLGRQILSYAELLTLCKDVEGMVNDRPLVSASTETMEVLTPSMLLLGRKIRSAEFPTDHGPDDLNPERRWKGRQDLLDKFWKSWLSDYCPTLQETHKWFTSRPNLQVGDLVLIEDSKISRDQWVMARVKDVHQAKDGMVRSVTLLLPYRTKKGKSKVTKRSIHTVFPLELTREEDIRSENEESNAE